MPPMSVITNAKRIGTNMIGVLIIDVVKSIVMIAIVVIIDAMLSAIDVLLSALKLLFFIIL